MVWEPVSFNPLRGIDSGSYCASSLVYEGLVKFDENLELKPALASAYQISPDGLTYVFTLRPNLKFSDGSPLSALDVKACLMLAASELSPFRSDYIDIKEVEILSDEKLVVHLARPCQPLISRMAELRIVPRAILQEKDHGNSHIARHPVGNGPFRLREWQTGQELVFERNPYYWGAPAKLESLVWRVIPDRMALAAALGRGEVDLAPVDGRVWKSYLSDLREASGNKKRFELAEFCGNRTIYLGFNLEREPWKEVLIRKAFAHAIDRGAISEAFYGGYAVVPDSDFPETSWAFSKDTEHTDFDTVASAALLQKAGYKRQNGVWQKDGKPLALRLLTIKDFEELAQASADYLKRAGMLVEVAVVEYSTLRRAYLQKGNFDGIVWSRSFGPDPECTIVWSSKGMLNFCRLKDKQVDEMLTEARMAPTREARKQIYRTFQGFLANRLPWVFLLRPKQLIAFRSGIGNIQKGRQENAGLPWDNPVANAAFWEP